MPRGRTKSGKSKSPWAKWNPKRFKGKPRDIADYVDSRFQGSRKIRRLENDLYY